MEQNSHVGELIQQGAEARLYRRTLAGRSCIVKHRFSKGYRHEILDKKLTAKRTIQEARTIAKCRELGIPAPAIFMVDTQAANIYMEDISPAITVKVYLMEKHDDLPAKLDVAKKMGTLIGQLHKNNIVHGDLTTSNIMRRDGGDLVVIDFGLAFISSMVEDKAVDLYVLERALISTHTQAQDLFQGIMSAYVRASGKLASKVQAKLNEVRARGRKKDMLG